MCLSLQKEMGAKSTSASEEREEREERHAVSSFVKKHKKEYGIGVLFYFLCRAIECLHSPPSLPPPPSIPSPSDFLALFQQEEYRNAYRLPLQLPHYQHVPLPHCEAPPRYVHFHRLIRPFTIIYDQDDPIPTEIQPQFEPSQQQQQQQSIQIEIPSTKTNRTKPSKQSSSSKQSKQSSSSKQFKQSSSSKPSKQTPPPSLYKLESFLSNDQFRSAPFSKKRGVLPRDSLNVFHPLTTASSFTHHSLLLYLQRRLRFSNAENHDSEIEDDDDNDDEKEDLIEEEDGEDVYRKSTQSKIDPIVDESPAKARFLTDEELLRLVEEEERKRTHAEQVNLAQFIENKACDDDLFADMFEVEAEPKRPHIESNRIGEVSLWL